MQHIDSFYNFVPNDGSINFNELFSVNESGNSAKYSKKEFKDLFRKSLLESEGYVDDNFLDEAHAYYELGVLYENKSEWIESEGKNIFLDCDSHVILIKNGFGYMIEKSTLDIAGSLNEGLLDTIAAKWKSFKKEAKEKIKSVAKSTWDTLSYGAKRAWEFVKACGNAVVEFVKGMTWIEWTALAMSLLSAILGIVQAALIGSGVASWVSPAAGILAGIFQAIGGGLHLYEGSVKIKNATKILSADQTITPVAKMAAKVTQGLPEYVVGGGMIALGVYDVVKAATSIVNPTTGIESVAVGTSAKTSLKGVADAMAKPGHAIHGFIEHVGTGILKKAGIKVTSKVGEAAVGKIFTAIVSTVSSSILSQILGKIWAFILKAGEATIKGFDYLISIPKKISEGIENFVKKSQNSTFFSIIAKGLSKIVKPLSDSASNVIAKYIQPVVNDTKEWFAKEIKAYKEAEKIVEEYKHELHSGTKEHEMQPHGEVKNPNQPKNGIEVKKVSNKEAKKIKESLSWEGKYIKSFDNLSFS